jgi:hypothetical protein
MSSLKKFCRRGHPFDAQNTITKRRFDGSISYRVCRECLRRRNAERALARMTATPEPMDGARSICWQPSVAEVRDHASLEEAVAMVATVPCCQRCQGQHALVVEDGGRLRAYLPPQPQPTLADELAELYPRDACLATQRVDHWPAPAIWNPPLTPAAVPAGVPSHQDDHKRQPTAALDGQNDRPGPPNVNDNVRIHPPDEAPDQCRHGHDMCVSNVYVRPDGRRRCRACMRAADRRPGRKRRHAELQRERRWRARHRRGYNRHKQRCKRGHRMSERNTSVYRRDGYECWTCRACRNARRRKKEEATP